MRLSRTFLRKKLFRFPMGGPTRTGIGLKFCGQYRRKLEANGGSISISADNTRRSCIPIRNCDPITHWTQRGAEVLESHSFPFPALQTPQEMETGNSAKGALKPFDPRRTGQHWDATRTPIGALQNTVGMEEGGVLS